MEKEVENLENLWKVVKTLRDNEVYYEEKIEYLEKRENETYSETVRNIYSGKIKEIENRICFLENQDSKKNDLLETIEKQIKFIGRSLDRFRREAEEFQSAAHNLKESIRFIERKLIEKGINA